MKPWVFIDLSYLAHRARWSLRGLSYEDFETGVLFGFFEQLRTVCFDPRILSNRVALFCDSHQSYRKKFWPLYKAKRHEDYSDEEIQQLRVTRDQVAYLESFVFPAVGFPTYKQTGLESDDLMAAAGASLRDGRAYVGRQAVIITADGDLYQSISPQVHWYDPMRNLYLDPAGFRQKKGIEPSDWPVVKALAGCTSDGVTGIPGVGEKTAIRFIKNTLPPHHKTFRTILSVEGKLIMARNAVLVTLPYSKTKAIELREPKYNPDAFFKFCEKFGMKSYLEGVRRREWEGFFKGQMNGANNPNPRRRNKQ